MGYPVDVSPEEYGELRAAFPEVRYRVLDSAVQNDTLGFYVAPLDIDERG